MLHARHNHGDSVFGLSIIGLHDITALSGLIETYLLTAFITHILFVVFTNAVSINEEK